MTQQILSLLCLGIVFWLGFFCACLLAATKRGDDGRHEFAEDELAGQFLGWSDYAKRVGLTREDE